MSAHKTRSEMTPSRPPPRSAKISAQASVSPSITASRKRLMVMIICMYKPSTFHKGENHARS
jgi:hypothetical protein